MSGGFMHKLGKHTVGEVLTLVAPLLEREPEDVTGVIIIGVCSHSNVAVLSTAARPEVTVRALEKAIEQVRRDTNVNDAADAG